MCGSARRRRSVQGPRAISHGRLVGAEDRSDRATRSCLQAFHFLCPVRRMSDYRRRCRTSCRRAARSCRGIDEERKDWFVYMATRYNSIACECIADDVTLGEDVKLYGFVNLYGCTIGDRTKIGTFVEIQKGATIGADCKISSHTFICEGVTIQDR